MYPDLSYFFYKTIGTQPDNAFSIIKTFGLLLVLAILSAAALMIKELKRKEAQGLLKPTIEEHIIGKPASIGEMIGNAIVGFLLFFKVAFILVNFETFKIDPAGVVFSTKGNWILGIIGAGVFAALKYYEKQKTALPSPKVQKVAVYPHERMADITMLAAISGVVGAKVFALVEGIGEMSWEQIVAQFFSGAGLAIYGGLLVGFACVFSYLLWKKINPIHVMDAFAPAYMVSYAVGRMGCQLSGDGDWGIPIDQLPWTKPGWIPDWFWGQTYPNNVADAGHKMADCAFRYCYELPTPVFPTPIWEIAASLLIAGFLWSIRKKITIPGMLFFIFLIFNGIERWFVEYIRINDTYEFMGGQYSQAQFIAAGLMLAGVIGTLVLWIRGRNQRMAST